MKSLYEDRKERINEYIQSKEYHPVKIKQLAAMIGVPSEDKAEFRAIIKELIDENKIFADGRGKLKPASDIIITGRFSQTQKGFGFVIPSDGGEDIFIKGSDTLNAMHDDVVVVQLNKGRHGRNREGVITEVKERAVTTVVGTLDMYKNYAFVISDSVRQVHDLFIPGEKLGMAEHGDKVVALITDYGDGHGKNPMGEIIEVLGAPDDPGVDILSIAKAFGIPEEFPDNVTRAARRVPREVKNEDLEGRKDLRNILTITIDGEDAKDLDDAVTLSYENGIYTLGVHIADVTNYV